MSDDGKLLDSLWPGSLRVIYPLVINKAAANCDIVCIRTIGNWTNYIIWNVSHTKVTQCVEQNSGSYKIGGNLIWFSDQLQLIDSITFLHLSQNNTGRQENTHMIEV